MLFGDLFELEDELERDKHRYGKDNFNSTLYKVDDTKSDIKFYMIYQAFLECHLVMKNNNVCEHKLYDLTSMKPTNRILEITENGDTEFFNIESFMDASVNKNSFRINNTTGKEVNLIPCQLRSMITDGKVT